MKSIQGRLTLMLVATVLILVACADALLYAYASSRLTAEFDRAMFAKAQMVSGMIAVGKEGKLEFDGPEVNLAEFREQGHHAYFEVRGADESVFARSPSLGEHELAQVSMAGIDGAGDIDLPDGSKGRALGFRFKAHREDEEGLVNPADKGRRPPVMASVVLAQGRDDLDKTLRVLASSLLGSAIVIVWDHRGGDGWSSPGIEAVESAGEGGGRVLGRVAESAVFHGGTADGTEADLPAVEQSAGAFGRGVSPGSVASRPT